MAAQDDHDHIAAADTVGGEDVGGFVRPVLYVGEGEAMLFAFGVAPDHGGTVGVVRRDVVDDVVGEVKAVGVIGAEAREQSLIVEGFVYIALIDVSHVDLSCLCT